MNKKVIYIGLGILAVGGLAYYFMSKPTAPSMDTASPDMGKSASNTETSTAEDATESGAPNPSGASAGSKTRKQVRKDCRAEARARGLRGRAKRQFRKECKAAGGVDDAADFAFNGFQDPDFN